MRNNSWLNVLFGQWENIWLPGYFTNAQTILSNAKPGMTAAEALKIANEAYNFGMFTDYGFPGNIYYPWNVNMNVNKSTWRRTPDLLKDIYAGVKELQSGGYLATVLSGKGGLFIKAPQLKPKSPAQTYHNNYIFWWRWISGEDCLIWFIN